MSGVDPSNLDSSDAGRLLDAAGVPVSHDSVAAISPWRFAEPISPDMAAARAGTEIDFIALLQFCREDRDVEPDVLLIEGVGGVMAPIGPHYTVLDWIAALGHRVLLVGGTYLGAISHILTAHYALKARSVPIAAVILSESVLNPVSPRETRDTLARHMPQTPTTIVRRGAGAPEDLASLAGSLGGG